MRYNILHISIVNVIHVLYQYLVLILQEKIKLENLDLSIQFELEHNQG